MDKRRPYVQPHELIFDPQRPLSAAQQRGLIVRLEMEARRTGKPITFPDLQRLPIDPTTMVLFAIERRKVDRYASGVNEAGKARRRAATQAPEPCFRHRADREDARRLKRIRCEARWAVRNWLEPIVQMSRGLWPRTRLPLHQGSWVRYIGREGELQQPVAFGTVGQVASARGLFVLFPHLNHPLVVRPDLLEVVPAPPPGRRKDVLRRWMRRVKSKERTQARQ